MRRAISPRLAIRTRFKGRRPPWSRTAGGRWRVSEEEKQAAAEEDVVAGGGRRRRRGRPAPTANGPARLALSSSMTLSASGPGAGGRLTRTRRNGIQASGGRRGAVGRRAEAQGPAGRARRQRALHRQRGVHSHRRRHALAVERNRWRRRSGRMGRMSRERRSRLPYQTETASRSLPVRRTPPDGQDVSRLAPSSTMKAGIAGASGRGRA